MKYVYAYGAPPLRGSFIWRLIGLLATFLSYFAQLVCGVLKANSPADYARFIMTMMEGMSVRAAAGATRKELHKIADMALRAWPLE